MVRLTKELIEGLANRPQYPECGSHLVVKDGKQCGKQTFLCEKNASVVLLPMLNTNSDLVILKSSLLGFLFAVNLFSFYHLVK